ncbi:alpha/beta fold hydrolase [Mycobacterium paraterrae]|uniref:Alpha/beta fold hydrolase n=1 Tax=Mycobacterium paraterrae TaxID=577492 RepID=A0ABY3VVS7_9MYCO|nr:alpha/beta fold hydrolase [Mycobacterium paraterrae]UMB72159.1 alpha/beta fold hydrolase [Mycobacterium paraterrae]
MDSGRPRCGLSWRKRPKSRLLHWLIVATVCLLIVGCANSTPVRHDGQTGLATPTPPGASRDIAARQADAVFNDYRFRNGEPLSQLRIHYSVLGQPHRNQQGVTDNAILLLHWTNASGQALLAPEFRDALFAPGAPFDATRFFVIIPDDVGHGQSSKPSDGLRAGFPHYGYADVVDLQHKLVTETLGISHLRAAVGLSMGCMNAWQWAETYTDTVDAVMPIACFPAPVSGRNLLWRRMAVNAIKSDPAWAAGNYQQPPPSAAFALQITRMMIDGVAHLQDEIPDPGKADAFLRATDQQAAHVDANDLLYSLESSSDFNAEPALGNITTKVFAVNFADDEFYRDSLAVLQHDLPKVKNARLEIRPVSEGSAGHFTMTHPRLWRDQAAAFMAWSTPH